MGSAPRAYLAGIEILAGTGTRVRKGDQFRVQPIHPMSKRPDQISRVWLRALPR